MVTIRRVLPMELPAGRSAFLWGPRKTGKTTLLRGRFPESLVFDFLDTDLFLELSRRPALLRERLDAQPASVLRRHVILDEVQKVPRILDEVHALIEKRGLSFVLCGSSARKLKRGRANLLGGRAWRCELFPLVSAELGELGELDLLRILNRGLLPSHYLDHDYRKSLRAYVRDYLKEEVFDEGLTRNLPAFARFFDAVGYSHGQLTNYSSIARDCGVSSKTVREYYQILSDTLLGRMIEPFKRRQSRQVIQRAPKFYLFDVGVAGAMVRRNIEEERGEAFGRAFEHFVCMELTAHAAYSELDYPIRFWRTKAGQEVDFVLGDGEVAIEVKGSRRVDPRDLHGLRRFVETYAPRAAIVVCNEPAERVAGPIRVLPYATFLRRLWCGEIFAHPPIGPGPGPAAAPA